MVQLYMKYNCIACNYFTDDLSNWNKHIKSQKHEKKNACIQNETLDEKIKEEINELVDNKMKIFMDDIKNFIKKSMHGDIVNSENSPELSIKSYVCLYCNIQCTRASNLTRHMKKCPLASNNIPINDEMKLPHKMENHI